jgi:competence CoiA-like predicted nuclease
MLFALDNNKVKTSPSPKANGTCIVCGEVMVAKCGEKMVWHWAHKAGSNNCDLWYETITDWHIKWLEVFPEESREVAITKENYSEKHVIDILTRNGIKIDLQSTKITVQEFDKRNKFWGNAIWIINAEEFYKGGLTFINNNKKTKDLIEIVEGWHYPEAIIDKISKEVSELNKNIVLSNNLYSYNKNSRLIFELKVEKQEMVKELEAEINKINAKYIFKCGRRTPWVYHIIKSEEKYGMYVLDEKGGIAGKELYEYDVFFDNVKGLEGSLFDLKNSSIIDKEEFKIKFAF